MYLGHDPHPVRTLQGWVMALRATYGAFESLMQRLGVAVYNANNRPLFRWGGRLMRLLEMTARRCDRWGFEALNGAPHGDRTYIRTLYPDIFFLHTRFVALNYF